MEAVQGFADASANEASQHKERMVQLEHMYANMQATLAHVQTELRHATETNLAWEEYGKQIQEEIATEREKMTAAQSSHAEVLALKDTGHACRF